MEKTLIKEDGTTRDTATPSRSLLTASIMPADIITLISRLFDQADDLLSFTLINKRFYGIVFGKIADADDKPSQILLNLHLRTIIGVVQTYPEHSRDDPCYFEYYSCLPGGVQHGKFESFHIHPEQFSAIALLCQQECDLLGQNNFLHNEYTYYLRTTEMQHQMILLPGMERACMRAEGHKSFGHNTGTWRHYFWLRPTLHIESNWWDGQLHGEHTEYDAAGWIKETNTYWMGVLHGPRTEYTLGGNLWKMTEYKNGVPDGQVERWDNQNGNRIECSQWRAGKRHGYFELFHYDTMVRTERSNWQEEQQDGVAEKWHFSSGIRTELSLWKQNKSVGTALKWSGETAMLVQHDEYNQEGQLEGMCEQFDKATGKRTQMSWWKEGQQDGVFEQWDATTGTRIQSSQWSNGVLHGTYERWNAETGICTHISYWLEGNEAEPDGPEYACSFDWDGTTGEACDPASQYEDNYDDYQEPEETFSSNAQNERVADDWDYAQEYDNAQQDDYQPEDGYNHRWDDDDWD